MAINTASLLLQSADHTSQIAHQIGPQLATGDCILLDGPVGAGKTHFARTLIQSILRVPEDVPSPTFTLVQTYETAAGALWHADLYRLSDAFEIDELGIREALETAICLIEWPDRLGALAPDDALHIRFAPRDETTRMLTATWQSARWQKVLGGVIL